MSEHPEWPIVVALRQGFVKGKISTLAVLKGVSSGDLDRVRKEAEETYPLFGRVLRELVLDQVAYRYDPTTKVLTRQVFFGESRSQYENKVVTKAGLGMWEKVTAVVLNVADVPQMAKLLADPYEVCKLRDPADWATA